MGFDGHANFSVSAVATAPSPATSGTSLVVTTGQGAWFPTVPFNAVAAPPNTAATPTNSEIVRVTTVSTDTMTIVRAQESTSAQSIAIGWQFYAAITKKTLTDMESSAAPTEAVNTVGTSGASQTIPDPSVIGNATFNKITLTAACTLTFPTPAGVCSFSMELIQDATGGRTVTWPGGLKWAGRAGAPTLSTAASAIDFFTFMYDGSAWLAFPSGLNMG